MKPRKLAIRTFRQGTRGRRLNNGRCVFPAPKTWGGTLVNISHLANQSFHVIRSYQQ